MNGIAQLLQTIRKFILVITAVLMAHRSAAGEIQSFGVPYVQNYSKSLYQSGNQNWSVTKAPSGIMYFGNGEGLLAFDGRFWQQYRMPNHLIVRSVAADSRGRVYAGAFGEFGYWSYNAAGRFIYHSLAKLVPSKYALKDEIWKIYVDGNRVLFQSFANIFIYERGKIHVMKADQPFFFLFKARNRFFVEVMQRGLFELRGEKLFPIRGSDVLGTAGVLSILPFGKSSFLIGTAKNGLFIYDGSAIRPWVNQANLFLKTFQLNNGCVVMDRYYAFGTILNGLIIVDESGRVVQRINKSGGLQNNTVLSIYADNEQNLWAGLDNGIDRVELNSPLYFYFDKKGDLGTVYSSIIYQGKIYLGTNQGLFYSDLTGNGEQRFQNFDFRFIPNSQGQVWDLALIDGQLLCGHNNGTFLVSGNSIKNISATSGGWTIRRLNSSPGYLIQGTYNGLVVYRKGENGSWVFSHRIQGFEEPSRYVEQDSRGQIWVGHAYKGVYKLQLSPDLKKVVSKKYYGGSHGLPGSYHINVFELENRIVFSSDSGFFLYDDISDRFLRYHQLNRMLGSFAFSNKIIPAGNKWYWFINHGRTALVNFAQPGRIFIDSTRFTILNGRMVQYYENISRINGFIYLISIDDGFAIFNGNGHIHSGREWKLPQVLIRRVDDITDSIHTITEHAGLGETEIPYKRNSLRISYSLPYYSQAKVQYQFFLEGYSDRWSSWSSQASKEFTNLPAGDYTFKVRAGVNDKAVPGVAVYRFTILPPWYLSKWAFAFYILLHVAAFFVLRRLYYRNLLRHQIKIQRRLQKEKEEQLRQEAIVNEQKIVRLRNEQLQADLQNKNRELASSAMNIVYKNELLQKIKAEIYSLKDASGNKLAADQLRKIDKVIDEGLNDDRDWDIFEKSFNETHGNFFKKLKAQYPELVPNDLKLCAYLRMNMSSKEIASLLNITLRGVEIRRYRLRKKLNLEHDMNLTEFFLQL